MKFFIIILTLFVNLTFTKNCREKRCHVTKVYRMKGVDCFNQSLDYIPQCFADDTEVFDLSVNRLREINKDDFSRYGRIKYLYLYDNILSIINNETLQELTSLKTLDLGLNNLINLNPLILHLPSLERLYLRKNFNMNLADTVEKTKPITSPLIYIDISFISRSENGYIDFPNFGVLPRLENLNISYNFFKNVKSAHFAGLCQLKVLYNDNVTIYFDDACDCVRINDWLSSRNVTFTPFGCHVSRDACQTAIPKDDLKVYEECYKTIAKIQKAQTLKKVGIYVGIALLIVLILVSIYIWHVLKKRREKNQGIEEHPLKSAK